MEQFHDQVSVDDQVNKVMSAADVIRRGDPNGVQRDANGQPVLGPDGKPQQNLGYLGMKGEDALHARGGVEAQIDQQIAAARSNLSSPEARLQFDQQTRRMRSAWANEIGDHAERQAQVWGVGVQNSAADLARQQIAANPGDSEEVLHRTADLVQARVRQAQLTYGNDPTAAADAGRKARAESATTQVEALLNKNPTMAKSVLEANRAGLDPQVYDQLVNRLRPMLAGDQADQAIQRAASGQPVAGGAVQHTPPAGGSPTISDVDALAAEKRLSAGTGTDADRALRATYLQQQNTPPGQQPAAVPAAPSGAAAPATAANGLPLEGPIPPTRPTAAPSAAAPQIGAQEPQDGGNPLLALRNAPAPSYQGWHATLPSAQKANFDTIAQHEADKNGTSLAAGRAAVFKNLSDAAAARGVVLSGGRAQYDAGSQAGPQAGPANIDWDKGGANNAQKFKTLMSYGTSTLGATPNGAAGMLGNAYTESNFRVAAFNPTGEKSHGLFQWNEDAGRWQPYVKWAQSNSLPVYDPYTQFQYAKVESQRMPMHDGSGRSVWQAVNQASSPAEASNIWLVHFENPKVKDFANRANFANEAMTHFDPNFRAPTQSGAQWQGGSAVAPMPGPLMASTLDNGQGGLPPMLPDPSVPSLLQQAQATPSVAPPPAAPTMRQQVPPASAADSAPQALPPPVAYNQDDPSSPLPDRGLALAHARAMAGGDPIQARMNVAEVNRRYEEQNRETYTERMELQQQLPDLNAAASAGVNGVTLPERDIMRLFPTAKALQIIGEFRANQAVGGLMRGVQWASPDQLQEMQRDISSGQGVYSDALRSHRGRATTGAGTTGAEEDSTDIGYFRRRETAARQVSAEIQRRTNLLVGPEADPAAYTANNPAVRQAWAQLQANPRDPASYERYAASMLSTQAFLGVPEAQQHLMTRGGATTIANQIASSPDPKATLQQLSAGFGSAWPKVFGDAIALGRAAGRLSGCPGPRRSARRRAAVPYAGEREAGARRQAREVDRRHRGPDGRCQGRGREDPRRRALRPRGEELRPEHPEVRLLGRPGAGHRQRRRDAGARQARLRRGGRLGFGGLGRGEIVLRQVRLHAERRRPGAVQELRCRVGQRAGDHRRPGARSHCRAGALRAAGPARAPGVCRHHQGGADLDHLAEVGCLVADGLRRPRGAGP